MHSGPKLISHVALLMGALLSIACGGTIAFNGENPIGIVGTPPAPPPPPPPPKEEPPPPPARVEVRDNKIQIKEKIQFEYNKAVILPASFGLLDEIVDVIKKNSHLKKIAIEGHASSEGDAKHNLKLSDDRAKSVMKYLVDKGVDAGRLTAKGFGSQRPIADNATDEGKEKNRRVEFLIIEQDITQKKVEVDHTGKEKVLEENKTTEKKDEPAPSTDDKKKTEKKIPSLKKKPVEEKK
jgi:outer membrane protein OmpA-like peptidoglycan-associated protein